MINRRACGLALMLSAAAVWAAPGSAPAGGGADALAAEVIQGARTDIERAAKLLAAAKIVHQRPPVMVALLEKAADYGLKARTPESVQTAQQAIDLLLEKAPDRKGQWQDLHLEACRVRQRMAAAADRVQVGETLLDALLERAQDLEEAKDWAQASKLYVEADALAMAIRPIQREDIASRRARAGHFERIAQQADLLKKALAADPRSAADRNKLVELLVIELDSPEEAAKFLTDDCDQAWRSYVPLAAKDPNTLPEQAAAELWQWYYKFLAPRASRLAKTEVLLKAKTCYERAIQLHESKDVALLTLQVTLGQIEKELAELLAAAAQNTLLDLLKYVDINRDAMEGRWTRTKTGVTLQRRARSRLRLPVAITGDYQLSIRFTVPRNGGLTATVPVGASHASVMVGGLDGTLAGLEPSDLRDVLADLRRGRPIANVTKLAPLEPEQSHQLDIWVSVKGTQATITAELDRKSLLRWRGSTSAIKVGALGENPPEGVPVLQPGAEGTTFLAIRLRTMGGKAKLLVGKDALPPAASSSPPPDVGPPPDDRPDRPDPPARAPDRPGRPNRPGRIGPGR